jgi:hypothetical protein
MRVFMADLIQLLYLHSELTEERGVNPLESYYRILINKSDVRGFMTDERRKKKIFLDSGAFSAFTKGVTINIDEYIAFIYEWMDELEIYASLDVIGNPEETFRNQKYMEEKGLKPLPTFHYGSDIKYLLRYLQDGYEFIALGGMVPVSSADLIRWLDYLFTDYLTDEEGWPLVAIHGFGMTSIKLILRYPWYSVDSTSWVLTSRFGSVLVPNIIDGERSYNHPPLKVEVSSQSRKIDADYQHFTSFPKHAQRQILEYFEQKGVTYEELSEEYKKRDILNITFFSDFEKNHVDEPFKAKIKQKGRFFDL